MVRTLTNAFETGRIPQAWMLTGVRGVGKTTTARILARALNYEGRRLRRPDLDMPRRWASTARPSWNARHVDVLEMDAASHTGIDDIREIIERVRYSPVTARYKVYIIDEVHMLSSRRSTRFLKTLEEPPPHAKFIFATTEIRKVPVTILSRCQRFDLRRIEADVLVAHLGRICASRRHAADDEALAAIARAAEGSARDGLSLMDQAIAHGAGVVTGATGSRNARPCRSHPGYRPVRRHHARRRAGGIRRIARAIRFRRRSGGDPCPILRNFSHVVTRLKLIPDAAKDPVTVGSRASSGT